MTHPSDTPPDGDFARYVERLMSANAVTGAAPREDLFRPQESGPASTPFAASSGMPSVQTAPQPAVRKSFWEHAKWILVAWIATQALARILPGASFLFIPALMAYAAWVIFSVNRASSGALVRRFRELSQKAIDEARKAQHFSKK